MRMAARLPWERRSNDVPRPIEQGRHTMRNRTLTLIAILVCLSICDAGQASTLSLRLDVSARVFTRQYIQISCTESQLRTCAQRARLNCEPTTPKNELPECIKQQERLCRAGCGS